MHRPSRRPTARVAAASLLLPFSLTLAACGGADPDAGTVRSDIERKSVAVADASAVPGVVAATDELGRVMLAPASPPGGADCAGPDGPNAVVSPASLAVALAMLTEGAGSTTLDSLDVALGASGDARTDAFNALSAAVGEYDGDPAVAQDDELPDTPVLHLANQAVIDDDLTALDTYLDALAEGFGAGVQHTDLGGDEGKAILDAWTNEHTGGLIEESAITPDPDLRLVLQNAVLLAARWQQPFTETRDAEPFTLADGTSVRTEAVWGALGAPHATHGGWEAVRLSYTEGFHADVILPPAAAGTAPGDGAPAAPDAETWAALDATLSTTEPRSVALTMPTLDVETGPVDLCAALYDAGLGELYETPDLSAISEQDLVLTQAAQQVVLQVDAEGTVAAALTELGMAETSVPVDQVTMTVDRPYLLRIAHSDTSWPLFLAAIGDPRH
ncbi:serpin family protein [Myceligenerans xiligouense]|uniref:Serine protease inhibitor n=1 Tax=Myceligenerans xiligouense TaxID=253184 RepID=A0A3N4YXL2_9MICO|nr:serpin family protein [Myceligenerans xiligouense]RPF23380.1 serine protease inhibitor [Myceligenerans xiligouense]